MVNIIKLRLNSVNNFQDMICCRKYDERLVASFTHQIKPAYYGGNISMYIEGIVLENFNALPQTEIKAFTKSRPRHAVFHFFLSDDSKKDAATTTAHINCLIELLKNIIDVSIKYNMGKY